MQFKKKEPRQCSSPITIPAVSTNDDSIHRIISDKSIQKPQPMRPDPILNARLSPVSSFKRVGSIGVVGTTAGNNSGFTSPRGGGGGSGAADGILRRGSSKNTDDSSLESIAMYDGYNDVNDSVTFASAATGNNNKSGSPRKSVRWNPSVKGGHGCNPALSLGNLSSLITNLSEMTMKNISKLDGTAQQLGKGLEGLGMQCTGGGARIMSTCAACADKAFENTKCGIGGGGCAKCSINDGLGGGLFVGEEDNDLVYKEKRDDDNTNPANIDIDANNATAVAMQEAMFETREAIKESRDAIVASRDAILGSYEDIRETVKENRNCMEDSRDVLNNCREAVIQSNNVVMQAQKQQAAATSLTGRNKKQHQYRQSSSPRASAHNIEAGMGNGMMNSPEQDPFSSSMHAYQRSPRADAGTQTARTPASILKKRRSFGTNTDKKRDKYQLMSPKGGGGSTPTSPRRAPPTSPNARATPTTSRTMLGRRNKDKRYRNFTTKNATPSSNGMHKISLSTQDNKIKKKNITTTKVLQEQVGQQKTKTKTKKNISRLVIGGFKKPLKFMSHGVKSNLKNSRHHPKRILAITSPPDASTVGRYDHYY